VMRADLDGSNIETLVDTSQGDPRPGPDASKWCVGVAVDAEGGKAYVAPASHFSSDRRRLTEQTSRFFTTGFPSRSIWTWIRATA
jgi:hypothetical protein